MDSFSFARLTIAINGPEIALDMCPLFRMVLIDNNLKRVMEMFQSLLYIPISFVFTAQGINDAEIFLQTGPLKGRGVPGMDAQRLLQASKSKSQVITFYTRVTLLIDSCKLHVYQRPAIGIGIVSIILQSTRQ